MFSSFFYFLFSRVNNENEQSSKSRLLLFLVFTLSLFLVLSLMNCGKRWDTKKFGYFFPNYLPRLDLSRRIEMSRSGKCIETCSIDEDSTACFLSTLSNALFPIIPYFFLVFLVSFVSARSNRTRCIEIISKIVDDHERWWET